MLLFDMGYICITHAKGILQWREGIAYIFNMGGLSGILNHYFLLTLAFFSPFFILLSSLGFAISACFFAFFIRTHATLLDMFLI